MKKLTNCAITNGLTVLESVGFGMLEFAVELTNPPNPNNPTPIEIPNETSASFNKGRSKFVSFDMSE